MEIEVIELLIDEDIELSGVNAMSVVEHPAIESDFVALAAQRVELAEVDKEKRILMGPALIPNKKIYRRNAQEEYYIFFSEDTVRRASELFFIKGNQSNSTLEHEVTLNGLTVVESWIVEDPIHDKSAKYGLKVPVGTWMISMKVENDNIWNDYVKTGLVKGFSLEGYFADNLERPQETIEEELMSSDELEALSLLEELLGLVETELKSYDDYPKAASDNARKVLNWRNRYGDEVKGMTRIGWRRANQLAKRQPISEQTIARMSAFKRHRQNAKIDPDKRGKEWTDAGYVAWLGWGGTEGIEWAYRKLRQIRKGDK
jgi:hypothetical protein